MEQKKYTPDVWKLKRVIEEQNAVLAATKSAHYVLGPGAQFDDVDEPKKKKVIDNICKRLIALESNVKKLSKRLDKVEKKHATKKR